MSTVKNDFDIKDHDGSGIGLKLGGTLVTVSADEINALEGLATAELAFIDGVTAGTAAASKAVVLDASKGIATITSATITTLTSTTVNATNIDAGASGTAGTVDVFPSTASKGKIAITAADSAGDTTTTIVNASQAAARTYTIPDAGGAASFVMTEGAQTLNGTKTIPALVTTNLDAGASGTAGTIDVFPTTAAKGKLALSVTDQTGNTTVGLVIGAMAAARTITIPDPGAAANVVVGAVGTATATGGAATLSQTAGKITSEALTTAAGADYTLTLTNTFVAANDVVLCSVDNGTNTTVGIAVNRVTPGAGSCVVLIRNTHASSALNGTIVISFLVVKA